MKRGAVIAQDRRYRYNLTREWGGEGGRVCWIMLNPSTADGEKDDATIRRCIDYSQRWGYSSLVVVNLFAYRSTDPRHLRRRLMFGDDIVGPDNDEWITKEAKASELLVAAWGVNGRLEDRDVEVIMLLQPRPLHALATTVAGHPSHPLRLSKSLTPVLYDDHGL